MKMSSDHSKEYRAPPNHSRNNCVYYLLFSDVSDLEIQLVDVRYLSRNGVAIAYGLTDDDLYRVAPSLRDAADKTLEVVSEAVGTAHGEVWDWSKHGGHSLTLKLHWDCPGCGQHWFAEFYYDSTPNPAFEPSECNCVAHWFVHWDPDQAQSESRA